MYLICVFLCIGKIAKATLPKREHPLKDKFADLLGGEGSKGTSSGYSSGFGNSYGSYGSIGSYGFGDSFSSYGFDSFGGSNYLW